MAVIDLSIDAIAAGGDGVGRSKGLVVFVPRTAPGDLVTAEIAGKARFARGSLRTVVTPSPTRIDPPCPHYTRDKCGGCQLQHMTYAAQVEAKATIVRDALERIGKRRVELPAVERSPEEWRYRAKLTLAIRRRGPRWIAGLHPYDDPVRVFPLADCPITDRRVVAAWREIMTADAFFPEAEELRGSVRITEGGPTFVMMGGTRWPARQQFVEAIPSVVALWWEPAGHAARQLLFDKRDERPPSASFGQVNAALAPLLRSYVIERALSYEPLTAIDAYAGAGHTSAALAEKSVRVTAIEADADASQWSASLLPSHSRAISARVEDAIAGLFPADLVMLNPPRAGVHERV
ncbi:MAG TPA: hypothetical protein VGG76_03270, partial [Gemmatimonadaceae bacterium]